MHKIECPRCLGGKGEIRAFRHVQGGVCFRCKGRGYVEVKTIPKPSIAIIAIVVIVIILNKTGVSDSLAALTLATVAALLTGGGAAGAASVALTPFVGVPVGIFVGIYVFAKVVRLISGKK